MWAAENYTVAFMVRARPALIPDGRLIIVKGTGHNIHLDKPEALVAPLVEMIKQVREK